MGKIWDRTDKRQYSSRYSPEAWITGAQYILELICEKAAKRQKVDLPIKFWNLPEWNKFYKMQLRSCHALLKKYDERAIIRALNDNGAWNIYSLRAPWLKDIIERYQKVVEAEEKSLANITVQKTPESTIIPQMRRRKNKPSLIGKLKELDGDFDGEEREEG